VFVVHGAGAGEQAQRASDDASFKRVAALSGELVGSGSGSRAVPETACNCAELRCVLIAWRAVARLAAGQRIAWGSRGVSLISDIYPAATPATRPSPRAAVASNPNARRPSRYAILASTAQANQ
jgi:hypothetical protein